MNICKHCGSFEVNPGQHGRPENDEENLCDVCYWRKRAEAAEVLVEALGSIAVTRWQDVVCWEIAERVLTEYERRLKE